MTRPQRRITVGGIAALSVLGLAAAGTVALASDASSSPQVRLVVDEDTQAQSVADERDCPEKADGSDGSDDGPSASL